MDTINRRSQKSSSQSSLKTRIDELTKHLELIPSAPEINFQIISNPNNGLSYAVWKDCFDVYEFDVVYPQYFAEQPITSLGGWMNAHFLGRLH